jgi:Arm DNA-binding domain
MRRYPSAKDLARITNIKPGRYAVGHGAYLQIANGGTRSWLFRYRVNDKQHHMGMGSCEYVSLQEARQKASLDAAGFPGTTDDVQAVRPGLHLCA